ncbi:DUF2218 domain-containing protein [Corynebacterium pacaense]|uniref:DUF2218 domain-containing protein n=1 Tax=Corynebacterium pacaense TaxID=1816684 RepID=UPI0009BB014C|nr:DUF2218 domain-containing protein [Corynebacterium pacaense]
MILTSTARVATERPARYGKQLANHLAENFVSIWDADARRGSIKIRGQGPGADNPRLAFEGEASCDLVTGDGVLLIHIEAPAELIERCERILGGHLVGFGKREGLTCTFRRGDGSQGGVFSAEDDE